MLVRLLLLLIAAPISQALAQVDADRWNLSDLYPSAAAWNADAAKLEAQMKEFASCKGHLAHSGARLATTGILFTDCPVSTLNSASISRVTLSVS